MNQQIGMAGWMALLLAVLPCPASATDTQGVQQYVYEPDRIYPVHAGLGLTTRIELGEDEEILDYSAGFSSGWELARRGNVFYLKPNNVDVDTNLLVRTASHSYMFELKVVASDWRQLEQARRAGVHYRIIFSYPAEAAFEPLREAAREEVQPLLGTRLAPDRHYNFGYSYATRQVTAVPWLVPINAYDDGRFTYLQLPDSPTHLSGGFPAVFARDSESGGDFVVNTTVQGNVLVVHGTYPYLVIRHGNNVVGLRREAGQ